MSISVTVLKTEKQDGIMAYISVIDGIQSQELAVYVSPYTANSIPSAELNDYLHARALLGTGHHEAAIALATTLSAGSASTAPNVPDTRNWAAKWIAGEILS